MSEPTMMGDYYSNSLSPYAPINRDPIVTFTANPTNGAIGVPTNVTLTWTSDLGVSASINNGVGAVSVSGSVVVNGVIATTTWTLTINKLNGTTYQKQVTYTAS